MAFNHRIRLFATSFIDFIITSVTAQSLQVFSTKALLLI